MTLISEEKAKPKSKRSFDIRQVMLDVFRAELSILMKDTENEMIRPFNAPPDYDERFFIDRVVQDRDKIETAMMQHLQSQGIRLSRWQIRDFLKDVTTEVKAGAVHAPDYAPRIKTEEQKQAEQATKQAKKEAKKLAEKEKREKKKAKRGKRHAVTIPVDGTLKEFESIEEANRQTKLGRRFIQYNYANENKV